MKRIGSKNLWAVWPVMALLCALTGACGDDEEATPDTGGGGAQDTGGAADTGGVPDTGVPDTGVPDTGVPDTGVPDTGVPDAGEDAGTDAGWTPTIDELNGAIEATEIDGMAVMAVNFAAAFGEAAAQLEEIETLNPPPRPAPGLPECPVTKKDLGLDPKIILKYVTVGKDDNGNETEEPGCVGQNGVFATGNIEITRVGKLANKYTRVQFVDHKRGKRNRAPVFNGCIKISKVAPSVYDVESDPEGTCALTVTLGKELDGTDIVYNATICAALRVNIDPARNRLRLSDVDIRFKKGTVACDQTSRSVTISETDGTASTLEYPFPLGGKTTCPLAGSIRIAGKYFRTDNEYAALTYVEQDGQGRLYELAYYVDGNERVVNPTNPENGLTDLKGIEAMCLPDTGRLYKCLVPDASGDCAALKGLYSASAGEPRLAFKDKDAKIVVSGPLGAGVPQDVCSAAAAAEGSQVQDFSMLMQVNGNCAVTFVAGNPGYGTRPLAGCGELAFTNPGKTAFDIVNADGDYNIQKIFGAKSVSGTVEQDKLIVTLVYDVPDNAGARYCYSSTYLKGTYDTVTAGIARDRCLDHPLPPTAIWSTQNTKALWQTLDTWGKASEVGKTCNLYTDKLAQEVSYYDDILTDNLDGTFTVQTKGADIDWKDQSGNFLPITEAYGRGLVSVMADPVRHDGTADFWNPAPKAAPAMDATTREVTVPLLKVQPDACTDTAKCFKTLPDDKTADWNLKPGQFFGNTSASKGLGGKQFFFLVGRMKINLPDYQDFIDACKAYVSGCEKLKPFATLCQNISDPSCLEETQDVCDALTALCDKFDPTKGGLADPTTDLTGILIDSKLPNEWQQALALPGGTPGDHLNLDTADLKAIGETLRGIAMQKAALLPNEIYRDFAFAFVDLPRGTANTPYVTVKWNDRSGGKSAELEPTDVITDIQAAITPQVPGKDLPTSKRFYATSSKSVLNKVQYVENAKYQFVLGDNFTVTPPDNLTGTSSLAEIRTVPELNMCLPPPIILDNIYFPTMRWEPLIPLDGDLLAAILNGNKDAIDWSKLTPAEDLSGKNVVQRIGEAAKKMVTIYVGAYNRKEYRLAWPQARPLPQIYYHEELRDSIRIFPDVGFFVVPPQSWWDIAPSGRDYMHGHSQELIDYLLDIVLVRADHKVLTAKDLYGEGYPDSAANDVAVVVSMDIEWQPTIVLNSDKFPGGNTTHFWRRDLVGMLVPSYQACPSP
jgi:hypothetical protein